MADPPLYAIPPCPLCADPLVVMSDHVKMKICTCKSCGITLTIPSDAWLRASMVAKTWRLADSSR